MAVATRHRGMHGSDRVAVEVTGMLREARAALLLRVNTATKEMSKQTREKSVKANEALLNKPSGLAQMAIKGNHGKELLESHSSTIWIRQGDPLSPFLFILVMEGLHNAFEEAVGNGLITGVNIKNSTINVSHLFYADDVIITTDWNAKDMDNIIRVLHVFYLASRGLHIGSLKAFNLALLQNGVWEGFLSPNALMGFRSSKLIMVKKRFRLQMVVATEAFGLTLFEPSNLSPLERRDSLFTRYNRLLSSDRRTKIVLALDHD
ncbi:putative RNA-directed DNA polymerase, eukaryota, reverse transcriptase zinc-binding domain protein [Tanacetum coccineum]